MKNERITQAIYIYMHTYIYCIAMKNCKSYENICNIFAKKFVSSEATLQKFVISNYIAYIISYIYMLLLASIIVDWRDQSFLTPKIGHLYPCFNCEQFS